MALMVDREEEGLEVLVGPAEEEEGGEAELRERAGRSALRRSLLEL